VDPSTDRFTVLLLGAQGMLGSEIAALAPPGVLLHTGVDSVASINVKDRAGIASALEQLRPRWVINAAAYTRVDLAEQQRVEAFAVNGEAVGGLAQECASRGICLAHFSTDYVFSGAERTPYTETAETRALNAYGASKLRGEELLRASGARHLLIRTQWLFGRTGRSFPRTMWERAKSEQPTRVVNDQTGRPTYAGDLAKWTWELIGRQAQGIFHAANRDAATWFDVARRVFDAMGVTELLSPCTTEDYPTAAARPLYSVLDTTKLETTLGRRVRHWHSALDELLEHLRATAT
jgi:dTDP-4-dehydrorhamnose reductase